MTITKSGTILKVGKNFADAVSGKLLSHGELEINNDKRFTWVSTLPIADAERGLRRAAKKEGRNITLFTSQAVECEA